MNWKFWKSSENSERQIIVQEDNVSNETESSYSNTYGGRWYPVRTHYFDGEKNPGELGNPINLLPDYHALRLRSYEADLKSDIIKIITGKFFKWVVGTGLKLQSEPEETVLESEGILGEDFISFRKTTESRFEVYASSKLSDFSEMQNLHRRAREAFRTAFLGGDCLIVLRVENGNVNVQIIDGQEVASPMFGDQFYKQAEERGNRILHGIEINPRGKHVAFYVNSVGSNNMISTQRIEAQSEKTGRTLAWMIYGSKHRINHHRGVPAISAILEKAEKLERYTEATVSGAEERANIVYTIKHSRFSTGENPVIGNIKKTMNIKEEDDPHKLGETLSKNIASSTSKQTFNLPVGAEMTTLAANQEAGYDKFFEAVFVQLCAAVDIPPEVALQKYSSNYSASRAAINGWGYIIDVYRKDFAQDFYKNFYSLWLEVEILKNKIKAPGFLKSIKESNTIAIEAYCNAKFTGINMPHIDPLKEVKAVREMLGDPLKGEVPLVSHDRASELLNQGNWFENYKKFKEEDKNIERNVNNSKVQEQPGSL